MKYIFFTLMLSMVVMSGFAKCQSAGDENVQEDSESLPKLMIEINGVVKTATLVDNASNRALVAQLQQGNITYDAHDYGNFEKVGDLGCILPTCDENITTTAGDLILYLGRSLCIYYAPNTWNFTRIGKIDGATSNDIKNFVNAGGGNVSVTLSLESAGLTEVVHGGDRSESERYDLNGRRVDQSSKGLVISNGKKTVVR